MKILITADIHANKTRASQVVKFLNKLKEMAITEKVSAVVICGDFFDYAMTNTKASGFTDILNSMKKLCSAAKVIMIYGTPHHEPAGSLEIFKTLGATVIETPKTLKIGDKTVLAIPEPRRSDFIRKSSSETSSDMLEALNEVCSVKADLIIFHGEISGATLQNGIKAKSSVQLSKDMIKRTGAKLTVCGHIHTTEEVFKNVIYCGSPIPCNYKETHTPSVVLADLETMSYKRLLTDFPIMKTIEADKTLFDKLFTLNFKNSNIKIKLSLTEEERKVFNTYKETKRLKEATFANAVHISISVDKPLAVRTKDISKKNTMAEKLQVYASVNNIELSESILEKAKSVEDSLFIKYAFPSHNFELLSISLRGAIGIKNKEQIDIDFNKYDNGIVGLIGVNGSGKTTLTENCHPFPRLLTRSGALRNHFYLKDSHRIVTYSDENGRLYRFTIQISAHTKSGVTKYFAETSDDNGNSWTPVAECDGNLDTYSKYVEDTFGSIEIYLRTAFFAKEQVKGVPDIASATKGERIKLFSELIGTDNIAAMHDIVKEKMKSIDDEIKLKKTSEEQLPEIEECLESKNGSKDFIEQSLEDCMKSIIKSEKELQTLRKKQKEFELNYDSYSSALEIKNKVASDINALEEKFKVLTESRKRNEIFKCNKKQIEEFKNAKEQIARLEKELRLMQPKVLKSTDEFSELKSRHDDINEQLVNENNKLNRIDSKLEVHNAEAFKISDNCPTCGAKLSQKRKLELFKVQENFESELNALKESRTATSAIVSTLKRKLKLAKEAMQKKDLEVKEVRNLYDETDAQYKIHLAFTEINSEYDGFDDFEETPIEVIDSELESIKVQLSIKNNLIQDLDKVDFIDYPAEIERIENNIKELTEERVSLASSLSSIETEIKQINELRTKIVEASEYVKNLAHEYQEYSILETAYSNSGIMALELEASAPDIASLTNKILEESYGDKFYVNFSTLHQGKGKLIDDFSIEVTDTTAGTTAPIEYLSSGEKVWIIQALYYAFSIVRAEKTGFCFLVRFIDESDGSLDSDSRIKYMNMISSAHKNGQNRLTILITHSQELKELLSQYIQL